MTAIYFCRTSVLFPDCWRLSSQSDSDGRTIHMELRVNVRNCTLRSGQRNLFSWAAWSAVGHITSGGVCATLHQPGRWGVDPQSLICQCCQCSPTSSREYYRPLRGASAHEAIKAAVVRALCYNTMFEEYSMFLVVEPKADGYDICFRGYFFHRASGGLYWIDMSIEYAFISHFPYFNPIL